MKLSLIVLTPGKMKGKPIPVNLSQFLIGRDPQCQLRPASPIVSNRHCALIIRSGKVYVRDFDSMNGTFVNEKPVKSETELHDQDQLRVGPVAFGIRIEAGATGMTPPPPMRRKPADGADDEAAAAMLLAMEDTAAANSGSDSEEVPTGSTMMDILPGVTPDASGKAEAAKPDGAKAPPAKAAVGDTSSAAESILQRYWRRPKRS